jgi:hypothetical protein
MTSHMGLLRDVFSSGRGDSGRLLPRDAAATLESFGRFEGPASGGDLHAGIELAQTVKKALEIDPNRVLDEMVEACDSAGGWSYYGAWEILHAFADNHESDPRYVHIVNGVLETLEREGYGPGDIPMALTPLAVARQRAAQAASPAAEAPPQPEPEIPPLTEGERRLLQIVDRPDGNQNRIYLVHRRPSDEVGYDFVAVIQHSDSADFDFDTAFAWQRGADERTIYIRVAEAYANSRTASCRYWLEPDVQWFADRVS